MPRYRVIEKSFLRPAPRPGRAAEPAHLYEAGDIIEFDGPPGPSLSPIDAAARQATARELFSKARRGGGGQHVHVRKWAVAIGCEPRDIAHARELIGAFIAKHHPDPKIREQFAP